MTMHSTAARYHVFKTKHRPILVTGFEGSVKVAASVMYKLQQHLTVVANVICKHNNNSEKQRGDRFDGKDHW